MRPAADDPDPGSERAGRRRARLVERAATRRLALHAAGHYTAVVGFRVAVALAAVHAGLSPAAVGLVLAAFAIVPMLLSVHGGQLIDRVGVRVPMVRGTALAAVGAAACALVPGGPMLAAASAIVGLGLMAFHLGMQHAMGELGGDARRTANFNLMTTCFSVSGLVGPTMVGATIDLAGHRAAFALTAALLAAVWLGLRRFPFERFLPAGPQQGPPPPPRPPIAALRSAFALLGDARLRRLLAASLVASAIWDTFQFAMPIHGAASGLSASTIGLAIAAFSSGSLSIRLAMPWLVHRLPASRWLAIALVVGAGACAATPFAGPLAALLVVSFLVGFGPGIAQPLLLSALHGAAPAGRAGESAGLRMTLLSALQLALPVAMGVVAGTLGSAAPFWLYSAVAVLVGAWLARSARRDATT